MLCAESSRLHALLASTATREEIFIVLLLLDYFSTLTTSIGDTTASSVLICLEIVDKQLPMLVVSVRCVRWLGDLNNVEDRGALPEDFVHFLERAISSLGVEEVHAWYDEGIDYLQNEKRNVRKSRTSNVGYGSGGHAPRR